MVTSRLILAITAGFGVLQPAGLLAQQYPAKPIRYIVPSSAGSAVDTIGRVVAAGLTDVLGQQVVVEDRPGAGGNIGATRCRQGRT